MSVDKPQALAWLAAMTRARRFEERCAELYTQGHIRGFLHLYIGEEAVAAGALPHLGDEDAVLSTYREHAHALLRGLSARSIMAEMFGKKAGCCRGRGGSMHLFDAQRRFYGGSAIVAGHLPLAVGLALADKLQGRRRLTLCIFGDGAVAEGEFHEAMNLAALWRLPVLFLCENNLYGMGTHVTFAQAEPNLSLKAQGYRMRAAQVDGMDVAAVSKVTAAACQFVRSGEGPFFLEALTYRFRAHSMFDAELYRSKAEVEQWMKKDPLLTFTARMLDGKVLSRTDVAAVEEAAKAEVDDAVAFAEAAELEPVAELAWAVTRREVRR